MHLDPIKNSFRYYQSLYDIFQQFDKGLNSFSIRILVLTMRLFNLLGIHVLVKILVPDSKLKVNNSGIVAFSFTGNHNVILNAIRSFNVDVQAIYFANKNLLERDIDIKISTKNILLEALTTPNLGLLLNEAHKDPLLKKNFIRVFKLIGCYNIYKSILKPNINVLNFNDHTPYSVLLADLAKEMSVKNIYMQHASVSDRFPPLYHDINILFSQDSLDKYKITEGAKVITLFDIRMTQAKVNPEIGPSDIVLICTNKLDSLTTTGELVQELHSRNYQVIIRPHPRDERNWSQLESCKVSENDSIWDDLNNCNFVITNESAVILEALYWNKLVYKASFLSKPLDNYGFIKKGLIIKEHFQSHTLAESLESKSIEYDIEKLDYFIGDMTDASKKIKNTFEKLSLNG